MSDDSSEEPTTGQPRTPRGQLVWFLIALAALTAILGMVTGESELVWGLAATALVVGYVAGLVKRRRSR